MSVCVSLVDLILMLINKFIQGDSVAIGPKLLSIKILLLK